MRTTRSLCTFTAILLSALTLHAQSSAPSRSYKVLTTIKAGGEGGFDYVYADSAHRHLFIPRLGPSGHISVFNLDSLKPAGDIPKASAHGVAVDPASGHGFASSKPVIMFDAKTLALIQTIDVQGNPDGIMQADGRVYVFSHSSPNVTVINAKDGAIFGTVDLGGAPEQAVTDAHGRLYVDLEDKGSIAVVDTKTLKLVTTYSLQGKGDGCAGLAMDVEHNILFASCRNPQNMVILNAADGSIIAALAIGSGTDGAIFNPKTMEAFSSNGGDGTLTVVKENSPTDFTVEQTVQTQTRAKTLTLDTKTNLIYLITAEFTPPPPPQPGERPGRGQMVPDTFTILVVGK
jgi:DNA-binding beta-propeller fold protein YncE